MIIQSEIYIGQYKINSLTFHTFLWNKIKINVINAIKEPLRQYKK